jgi:hypothetical protein
VEPSNQYQPLPLPQTRRGNGGGKIGNRGGGQTCSVCLNKLVNRNINAALDEGISLSDIETRYSVSHGTLQRHKKHWAEQRAVMSALHTLKQPDLDSVHQRAPARGRPRLTKEQILQKASSIIYDAEELFAAGKAAGVIKDAVSALESVRRAVEMVGKWEGLGVQGPQTVIDQRQVTILNTVSQLSIEEMRAIAYGQPLAVADGATGPSIDTDAVEPDDLDVDETDDALEVTEAADSESDEPLADAPFVDDVDDEPPPPRTSLSAANVPVIATGMRGPNLSKRFVRKFKSEAKFKNWARGKGDEIRVIEWAEWTPEAEAIANG